MIRENILDNVVTTLGNIATASGYNNDIGLATRDALRWASLKPDELPAAIVVTISDEKESTGATGQTVLSTLIIRIRGVITGTEETANLFSQDIEKIMAVDGTRGGYAIYTFPLGDRIYQGADDYVLEFDSEYEILYQYKFGNP